MTQGIIFNGKSEGVAGSPIKSIQYGSITGGGTDTIDAVVLANSVIILMGFQCDQTGEDIGPSLVLTNTTTVTQSAHVDSGTITKFCVMEFNSGVIKSKQSGEIVIAKSSRSNTATVDEVTIAKSWLVFAGSHTSTGVGYDFDHVCSEIVLTNATTITATRDGTSSRVNSRNQYQLLEFN